VPRGRRARVTCARERLRADRPGRVGCRPNGCLCVGRRGGPNTGHPGAVSLHIVLATYALDGPGGTESYTLTVAHELQRLGHRVTLAAELLGPVARLAEDEGLEVVQAPDGLPGQCDAAIVHDAIVAGAVVGRYPHARVIHVAHSDLFDHQLPVLVDGVLDAVVAMSDRVASCVRALALDTPVIRLSQPIDQQRFVPAGPLPPRPRRALLLGNYLDGDRRAALFDAWRPAGIEFVQVGSPASPLLDVRSALASADIVVAKARAALEAMSCARAVYIYDAFGGDGWVTPELYPALEADAFAGQATSAPRGPAEIAADLADYRPSMGWINHELIRTHHAARRHACALVELLLENARVSRRRTSGLDEVARLSRRMWQMESRVLNAERRAGNAEDEHAELLARANGASQESAQAQAQASAAAEEAGRWRARAEAAEAQTGRARDLLATRRVRAGLALGRALDRVRGMR